MEKTQKELDYLNNMLYPEKCKGVKIPSMTAIPSCAFQFHSTINLTTNSSGNLVLVCNPYYLCDKSSFPFDVGFPMFEIPDVPDPPSFPNMKAMSTSSLWLYNGNNLTGNSKITSAEGPFEFNGINIGQDIPPLYDQYRLVSAALTIRYIGKMDNASGVIGGSIVFDDLGFISCNANADPSDPAIEDMPSWDFPPLSKYTDFNLIKDAYYHHENLSIEGMKLLYFPIDNSYDEFVKINDLSHAKFKKVPHDGIEPGTGIDTYNLFRTYIDKDYYKSGFNWVVYTSGAPANSTCFKLDLYCNFECLPNSSYLSYMPISLNNYSISTQERKQQQLLIQKNPILKLT